MLKLIACIACALALTITLAVTTRVASAGPQPADRIMQNIKEYRHTAWRLQTIMGVPRTGKLVKRQRLPLHVLQVVWREHAHSVMRRFQKGPPHRREWLCIHRYEGSWTDPGSPYYGGLQMDLSFQRSYGAYLFQTKGTADRWTALEQMWVAERAYRSGRGFYPWPNTARYCGLI
jgi:hypothetical protein